ncbi:hypothetical protein ES707_14427 [subsurface metagenome]
MAINVGYEILIGAAVSDDKKADLTSRVLQVLQSETLSVAYATTYDGGAGSTNQASIAIGTSEDLGIRIIMDSAVVGTKKVADILQRLISVLLSETVVLSHAVAYAAGSRAYNMTITVT